MKNLLEAARKLAYSKNVPNKLQNDIAADAAVKLAKKLVANEDIVLIGVYLMDCMFEEAKKEDRVAKHVEMSLERAEVLLSASSISDEDKQNIRQCILQHHGAEKFHSTEAEICCNADCYRWASVKGVLAGTRAFYNMDFDEFLKFAEEKVDEKWNALTLDEAKNDVKDEVELLKKMIDFAKR